MGPSDKRRLLTTPLKSELYIKFPIARARILRYLLSTLTVRYLCITKRPGNDRPMYGLQHFAYCGLSRMCFSAQVRGVLVEFAYQQHNVLR